jgi:regulator of RNase E activity RraB
MATGYNPASTLSPPGPETVLMSDSWDFYFANVNGEIASLFIDLGLADTAPDPNRPWLLWAWVYMNQARDDGLSSSEEAPRLDAIEEALMAEVEDATAGELVGRITTAGRREFYFYGPTHVGFEDAIARAMSQFADYAFDTGVEQDADWSHYQRVLYPSPPDVQRIKNRHVIEVLSQHGDRLEKPRIVAHWAYFPTAESRSAFVSKARELGFAVMKEYEATEGNADDFRHGVHLERIDSVDWASINEVTLELFELAETSGGYYDGWETAVAED